MAQLQGIMAHYTAQHDYMASSNKRIRLQHQVLSLDITLLTYFTKFSLKSFNNRFDINLMQVVRKKIIVKLWCML